MLRRIYACFILAACTTCSGGPKSAAPITTAAVAAVDATDSHAATAHGNHDPRHGGIVFMKGELHFEVVLSRNGTHSVYFSDASRAELPAATASEVTLAFSSGESPGETFWAEVDESGESWIVKGWPLTGKDVTARVSFVVDDEPYWIDIPYIDDGERPPP